MTAAVPVIETERLLLREPRRADFGEYAGFLASSRSRLMGGPYSAEDAWSDFAVGAAGWVIDGLGYWSVVSKATGRFAGYLGFAHPAHFPELELGWAVQLWAEGQGIAFEAAAAARDHGLACRPGFVSYVDPANARSRRLAERLGGVPDGSAQRPLDWQDVVYRFGRPQ